MRLTRQRDGGARRAGARARTLGVGAVAACSNEGPNGSWSLNQSS